MILICSQWAETLKRTDNQRIERAWRWPCFSKWMSDSRHAVNSDVLAVVVAIQGQDVFSPPEVFDYWNSCGVAHRCTCRRTLVGPCRTTLLWLERFESIPSWDVFPRFSHSRAFRGSNWSYHRR